MGKMEDAIVLCRISSDGQKDGYSLDAQERIGKEYCLANSLHVYQEPYRFVETGSKSHDRKKFDGMMSFISQYVITAKTPLHLVVEKPDRLTRNFTNREQLQFFVMAGKLIIHYYKDKRILDKGCSPADIFTDDIMTSVSKYIALNIAREAKKGMKEKARSSWLPTRAPLGYKNIRDGIENKHGKKESTIVIDPETKDGVLRIFELRAIHHYSYYAIRDTIIKEGLIPKSRFSQLSKNGIEHVLKNKFYEGRYFWDGEWFDGKHELFIPLEWIKKSDLTRGTPHGNHPLGRFSYEIKCGIDGCRCSVIYDPKTKVNRTTGEKRVYHYYHCADGKRFHKFNQLPQVNVSETALWDALSTAFSNIHLPPQLAKEVDEILRKVDRDAHASKGDAQAKANLRLSEIKRKEDELYEHFADGVLNKEAYGRQLERLTLEREKSLSSLIQVENVSKDESRERIERLLELCKSAKQQWESKDDDRRLKLAKMVCSNFSLDGANLRFDLKKPFEKLLELKRIPDFRGWYPLRDELRTALSDFPFELNL